MRWFVATPNAGASNTPWPGENTVALPAHATFEAAFLGIALPLVLERRGPASPHCVVFVFFFGFDRGFLWHRIWGSRQVGAKLFEDVMGDKKQ
ncbi:MAG: hypothetical protein AVDCRST_MAG05-4937 [uncultured Rubrobacteraceae bacterium]|uniref:Uncharacterized protein n=1 Tax=uncultured Rubrobacteraceae bacterium TaxID=349277 RepID=A0A6J4TZR1_9ACTN|nr:MAG: hypothetical protein AVDCRST_MAG05-4937 [uncultured Rubrobacteraceae bacterium]